MGPNRTHLQHTYEGCPESIQPFRISREPFAWPWCNLAVIRRRPYCASVNTHSPVGLVSRQREAVDWACVLCDGRIQNDQANRSDSSRQYACQILSSHAGVFFWGGGQSITSPRSIGPHYNPDLTPCDFWLFPNLKSPLKGRRFVNATVPQYTGSVNGVLLPTDKPHGRVTVQEYTVRSLLTGCQVTSRPRDRFSRYSKWLHTFRTALVRNSPISSHQSLRRLPGFNFKKRRNQPAYLHRVKTHNVSSIIKFVTHSNYTIISCNKYTTQAKSTTLRKQ